MSVTAKEIAKKLNISETAVSMALNNRPGVSTQTRKRIIQQAEMMGYDFSKLSRKANNHGDIYYIIYRAHNAILNYTPIFNELIEGIEQECRNNDYRLKTLQIYEHIDDLEKCLEDLRYKGCIGIILFGTEMSESVAKQFYSLNIPIVLIDTYFDRVECSSISINNRQGAYFATNLLIETTHEQPGYLKSSYEIKNFNRRRDGFYKSIISHGMSKSKSIIHELSPSIEGAYSDMLEILNNGDDIAKCYFADNDLIAIGAMRAFKEKGYKIPEDISIVGFDNISESSIVEPALTTVDIPRKFMGQTAALQLIREIQFPIPHTVKTEISTSIVQRKSTKKYHNH